MTWRDGGDCYYDGDGGGLAAPPPPSSSSSSTSSSSSSQQPIVSFCSLNYEMNFVNDMNNPTDDLQVDDDSRFDD